MRKIVWILLIVLVCVVASACAGENNSMNSNNGAANGSAGNEENGNNGTNDENGVNDGEREEVTLKIATLWGEDMFEERFSNHVHEAFPHITLEHIHVNNFNRNDLEELFATGEYPDIFFTLSQSDMEYLEIDFDHDELVEKHGYDLSHIHPNLIDSIRAHDEHQRLVGMPQAVAFYVLAYNKDIFDMFGESYPTDDMTWEEVINLARRVTGEVDGVKYRGLDFRSGARNIPLMQLSVNATDPETGEVQLLDKPEFRKFIDLYDNIFDIPENYDETFFDAEDRFANEQTTAMIITNAQGLDWWKDTEGLNFDIAAQPTWEDRPGLTNSLDFHTLHVSPYSEHQEEAFELLYYFTSDEYQEWNARNGIGPVINDPDIQAKFYQDIEGTQDKNVEAIFKHEPAPVPERISLYDRFVHINLDAYAESEVDPVTFLRQVAEEAETAILEEREG